MTKQPPHVLLGLFAKHAQRLADAHGVVLPTIKRKAANNLRAVD